MKDLDMSVQQYNTCVSILFVGYSTYDLKCFSRTMLTTTASSYADPIQSRPQ